MRSKKGQDHVFEESLIGHFGGTLETLRALDLAQVCIRDMDGKIRYWSRGNERLYGWSREEALGETTHVLLNTTFPSLLAEIEAELWKNGQWEGELQHRAKRGDPIWVASNWVLQRARTDSSAFVVEVNNDITPLRRADEVRRYLASIVDSSDDAIIGKDLTGLVTTWNRGAERIFGYQASEIIGKPITVLFPPEALAEEADIMERLRGGERIDHYDTVRLTKSGRRIAVSLTISPITDSTGALIGASKIVRDISERQEWVEALRASETRRRLAVEAGDLGLWSYKIGDAGPDWDPTCKAIFGILPDDPTPVHNDAMKYVHAEDRKRIDSAFEATVTKGRPFDLEFRVLDREGRVRWVQTKGRAAFDNSGRVTEIHGTILDFTVRKQKEDALLRANHELHQFAYAAAHDLQEPLRNVALSIELATVGLLEKPKPEAFELLNEAVRNAKKMDSMVKDLLAYTTALNEEDESECPVIDSNEVMREALSNLSAAIVRTSAQVEWKDLPMVHIRRVHLVQVLQNLISNALKYKGAKAPRLSRWAHSGIRALRSSG